MQLLKPRPVISFRLSLESMMERGFSTGRCLSCIGLDPRSA